MIPVLQCPKSVTLSDLHQYLSISHQTQRLKEMVESGRSILGGVFVPTNKKIVCKCVKLRTYRKIVDRLESFVSEL